MIRSKRFEGKVAIVTGSTQGIGYSIAHRLGLEGASVVISSRNQKNVDEATQKLKSQGIQVLGLVCHVSNAQQRKDLIHKTLEKFGKIDVIVSSVAVNPITGKRITTIMGTQESILDKMWEVNIKAPILLMKEAAPHMKKGSIIFISSISAYVQPISGAMYGVTKTTLLGLTKALAFELGPEVRVNCVASGVVPTRFSEIITTSETLVSRNK
ncbi:tropinone reductase-like 3 isoform X1 [Cannabis sativa]|uniref:tropinone reductase-like 3 isoform X1 n=1 Tax=Cannabis sativa TaxID=3483 RepID=UPI0029C9CAAC|nr:tropinone reductase-like 3 isoform X1 [Cannabis sativa]